MPSVHIPALVAVLALSGCVVREVHEIHYVQGESRTTESDVGAPGAIIADSQPPAPIVELAGEPPDAGYAWVDGYWHWDGAEWVWIDGRWVAPMVGLYFVAPSYYTSGDQCVYVPGRWQHQPDRGRRVVRHDSGRTQYHGSWHPRPKDDGRRPGHDSPGDDVWIGPAPRRDPAPVVAPPPREPAMPASSAMDPFGPTSAPDVGPPRAQPPRQTAPPSHQSPPR
ncbi:MAG TPA: hypothetical protein VMZ28_04075, partial [Kofleriaceae bacterium]|nr:hypothetical protein [Kofleriaceae bacterium]